MWQNGYADLQKPGHRRPRNAAAGQGASDGDEPASDGPAENRTDLRAGGSTPDKPDIESESEPDAGGTGAPGLDAPRFPGRSLSISSLSFPGNDAGGAERAREWERERGVAGVLLDVCVASVESDASDADGASVALSAVGGRTGFFSDERAGGGGRTTADMDARRVCGLGRVRSGGCPGWAVASMLYDAR